MAKSRRDFAKLSIGAGVGTWLVLNQRASAERSEKISLFDGRTLNGWIQIENDATTVSAAQLKDPAAFVSKLASGADPVSRYFNGCLDEPLRQMLGAYSASDANAKATITALIKQMNALIAGPSIYNREVFHSVALRPGTKALLGQNPQGQILARLNKMLLEDAYPADLAQSSETGWIVKDGAMASTGSGRGVIYTERDFGRFRLTFTMRHVSGSPDHQACVLFFCTRPTGDEKPLDALAGIQFQVPPGWHWDYRPGKNNDGGAEFSPVTKANFDPHQWSQVEILADATTGRARLAVAQPPGAKAVEVVSFNDPTAGKAGPIALQMHNAGLFDEYKDLTIEVNPEEDRLLTVG